MHDAQLSQGPGNPANDPASETTVNAPDAGGTRTGDAATSKPLPDAAPPSTDAAADVDANDAAPPSLSWTWENPNFQGNNIHAIWGSGANDVWFGASDQKAKAGSVFRWNGNAFGASLAEPTLALAGSSTSDVWSAGAGLRHFNGAKWAPSSSAYASTTNGVWTFGASDVWAIDKSGGASHFTGAAWTRYALAPKAVYPLAVYGVAPNDVWVASTPGSIGDIGAFHHWNGATWTTISSGVANLQVSAFWGSSGNDVWAVGYQGMLHWNGTEWQDRTPSGAHGAGVWGTSASDVWAVGYDDAIRHWDGASWTSFATGLPVGTYLYAVWGSAANDVWAGGKGGVTLHWDGATWSPFPSGTTRADLGGGWAASETDAWVVGEGGVVLHSAGDGTWSPVASPVTAYLTSVHGASANDVWAVGATGTILHWNGATWSSVESGSDKHLYDVRALGASDVWAVGEEGTILHYDGASWAATTSGATTELTSVWGAGGQVWAAGVDALLRWNGASWIAETSNQGGKYFTAMSGSSATDVWAVGGSALSINGTPYITINSCVAYHWDGATWSSASPGPAQACRSVWAEQPGAVWAVGFGDEVTFKAGASSAVRGTPGGGVHHVFGSGARIWAIGTGGTILRVR